MKCRNQWNGRHLVKCSKNKWTEIKWCKMEWRVKWNEEWNEEWNEMKWSEMKWSGVEGNGVKRNEVACNHWVRQHPGIAYYTAMHPKDNSDIIIVTMLLYFSFKTLFLCFVGWWKPLVSQAQTTRTREGEWITDERESDDFLWLSSTVQLLGTWRRSHWLINTITNHVQSR